MIHNYFFYVHAFLYGLAEVCSALSSWYMYSVSFFLFLFPPPIKD